jgi:hypothetical protein
MNSLTFMKSITTSQSNMGTMPIIMAVFKESIAVIDLRDGRTLADMKHVVIKSRSLMSVKGSNMHQIEC